MLPSYPGFLNGPGFRFTVGAFLVRTLLPGLFVSVCCVRSLFSEVLEDLVHFGVSYLEVLILFEQWAGHRLLSEKVTRPHERAHRPITISCVPVSGGIVIRQGCRFISSLVRALGELQVVLAGSCPVRSGVVCLGFVIWGGNRVRMGLRLDHWKPVTTNVSVRFVVFLGTHLVRRRSFRTAP